MKIKVISEKMITAFADSLRNEERSRATVEKYLHDVRCFAEYADKRKADKALVLKYKEYLSEQYALTSANSMLAALNAFLRFAGWNDCCVKQFKIQRQTYYPEEKELTRSEYTRLCVTAEKEDNERLSLVIQTLCGAGIRVSELQHITVETVQRGKAEVSCKGKTRTVFIVPELKKKLLRYIRKHSIESGPVFITKSGKPLNRSNIWREMKALCEKAGVAPEKVFPHNLRHLFARVFYGIEKDIAKLADILGHSSINTTRIYIMTTGNEHKKRMERMRLIL